MELDEEPQSKRNYKAEAFRREGLRALKVLLEEMGAHVVLTGKPLRVAGGVLRLSTRKARRIRDMKTGLLITIPATMRLTWKGPLLREEPHD